ncbi:UbiA family prenyltransferase [Sorangium sp. So ce136]|uniref:UbiA family prenyltransferase n=1 Tax=Sorangium sp. So ce136 TaxID=3133284 RepID=UPI003F0A50EF
MRWAAHLREELSMKMKSYPGPDPDGLTSKTGFDRSGATTSTSSAFRTTIAQNPARRRAPGRTTIPTSSLHSPPSVTVSRAASAKSAARPTPAFLGLWRAARWKKNLPLTLLLFGGMLVSPAPVDAGAAAVALLTLLASSAFMTHVNVLTDAELDASAKPEFYRWLSVSRTFTVRALAAELLASAAGIGWLLARGRALAGLGLGAFLALTVLYSYNYLSPGAAAARRLKAYWWGHLLTCLVSYFALWGAGLGLHTSGDARALAAWGPAFFFVSLSEYAVFLSESAVDAAEERRAGLKTLAALLGRRGSSLAAALLWLAAAAGLSLAGALAGPEQRRHLLVCFAPAVLWRGSVVALLAAPLDQHRDRVLRLAVPDVTFFGSRLLTVVSLVVLDAAS